MKKLIFFFTFVALLGQLSAQNPFKELGIKDSDYLTLSDGRYDEFHEYNDYERVGSAIIDMHTNKIARFIDRDSVIDEGMSELDMTTRFLTIDPMAEKYFQMSPYSYCANNPIRYIDPTGMYIDNYGVDENGKVSLLEKTDDEYDVLYAIDKNSKKKDTNSDSQVDESDGQKVNDKSILPQLSEERSNFNGRYATNESLTDMGNIFLFASKNTNVEFSFNAIKSEGENTQYAIITNHKTNQVSNAKVLGFDELDFTFRLHSHPGQDGTKGGSDGGATGTGDMSNIIGYYNRWINAKKDPLRFPTHGVFHKDTKTIYYYTPWKQSIKGHTF